MGYYQKQSSLTRKKDSWQNQKGNTESTQEALIRHESRSNRAHFGRVEIVGTGTLSKEDIVALKLSLRECFLVLRPAYGLILYQIAVKGNRATVQFKEDISGLSRCCLCSCFSLRVSLWEVMLTAEHPIWRMLQVLPLG